MIGKLKGSDYNLDQLSKRERGLKENRQEQVEKILTDQDAIEKERQLMMNKVNNYNPEDGPSVHQRKEIPPNLLSRYKSIPNIAPLDLKGQGKDFLEMEQQNKQKNFKLVPRPVSHKETERTPVMNYNHRQVVPVKTHRPHPGLQTTPLPAAIPGPMPGFG